MTDRILLSEWAGGSTTPGLLGMADLRPACPLCGHPTMDCTHHFEGATTMAGNTSNKTATTSEDPKTSAELKDAATSDAGTADGKPTGAEKQAQAQKAETDAVIKSDPTEGGTTAEAGLATAGVGDDAVVIRKGEEVDSSLYATSDVKDPYVVLQKDVVEEFYFPNTKRPSHRLLFRKGDTVRQSQLDALKAPEAPGDDVAAQLRAQVDSTTLASGTGATGVVR